MDSYLESNHAFSPTMQKWFELEYAAYKNIRQNLTFILISGETLYDHETILPASSYVH